MEYCPLHASAPDLLAALEELMVQSPYYPKSAHMEQVQMRARAAIRKAKGQ